MQKPAAIRAIEKCNARKALNEVFIHNKYIYDEAYRNKEVRTNSTRNSCNNENDIENECTIECKTLFQFLITKITNGLQLIIIKIRIE